MRPNLRFMNLRQTMLDMDCLGVHGYCCHHITIATCASLCCFSAKPNSAKYIYTVAGCCQFFQTHIEETRQFKCSCAKHLREQAPQKDNILDVLLKEHLIELKRDKAFRKRPTFQDIGCVFSITLGSLTKTHFEFMLSNLPDSVKCSNRVENNSKKFNHP